MSFTDLVFYMFFAIVFLMVLLIESNIGKSLFKNKYTTAKKIVLLVSSYVFYGYWNYKFCFLLLLLSIIVFICAKRINKGKIYSFVGIAVPLIILGIFKYFNFFVQSFESVFGLRNSMTLRIILPVGISFYTFQALSYIIDVKRNTIKAENNFINLALYISFFPQLVAGPIVKANEFLPQLEDSNRRITKESFGTGIQIFVFGLFKKIVLADNISVFVDDVFAKIDDYSALSIIFAVIAYSLQIYFDFSGYSDMAIGCAKVFGYEFSKNFNLPYLSKNVSEFWKRWHISLSSWLQTYLYIPLGGNRKGKIRTYINLIVTMVLGGLWHGANWTFVIWGLLHGIALCINKLFRKLTNHDKTYKGTKIGNILAIITTYIFVCVCWIFFRADNILNALEIIKAIVTIQSGYNFVSTWTVMAIVLLLIASLIVYIKDKDINSFYPIFNLSKISGLTCFFTFAGITFMLAYTNANPFVYFQF